MRLQEWQKQLETQFLEDEVEAPPARQEQTEASRPAPISSRSLLQEMMDLPIRLILSEEELNNLLAPFDPPLSPPHQEGSSGDRPAL